METELQRLNRAYRALCVCNGHVVRATSEHELLVALCNTLVDVGGYRMAWVGYAETDERRLVRPAAFAGADHGYLESIRVSWADDVFGQGPTGMAIRTGQPAINRDSRTNPSYGPWREQALQHGFQSSIALPLQSEGKMLGALAVYATQPDAFDTEECALLIRFAEDLSFGITALRTRHALQVREHQLRQAQTMETIGRLAGGVAHDINNVLSVILTYTTFLHDRLTSEDGTRDELEEVTKAASRATDLTRQLLAFSRTQVLEPAVLDLNAIVFGARKMLGRLLGEDISLSLLTDATRRVYADARQLEQVIVNLAMNARDAMPDGGHLTIETADLELTADVAAAHGGVAPGAYVTLSVADTGTGMDRATLDRIFDPFFTTKEEGKGTGLGLSSVHGVVEQSGGRIRVQSEPGAGTRFVIYLPTTDRPPEPKPPPPPAPVALSGTETVLVVEDDDHVRTTMRAILRRHGYAVLDAQNAGEALLLCEQHRGRIDLLLTDVVLPRMSGRELARRLAPLRPEMKFLFVSGYPEGNPGARRTTEPHVALVPKPITPEALARRVRDVLDGREPGEAPPTAPRA